MTACRSSRPSSGRTTTTPSSPRSTWLTYLNTLKYVVIVWACTFLLGFWLSFFLAFYVSSKTLQMVLFLICTVPFWTSNMIRMIAWVPFLGRNGLLNQALMGMGIIHQPLEFLLFSDFAVVLAFVHLDTVFMLVPIFNTMSRIDKRLIEAAYDAGAGFWDIVLNIVLPLTKPGIAIGSIFVFTLVMGDFITVRLMSGGQSASVDLMIQSADFPAAIPRGGGERGHPAADRAADGGRHAAHRRHPQGAVGDAARRSPFYVLGRAVRDLRAVPLRPDADHPGAVLPGARWRADIPDERRLAALVRQSVRARRPWATSAARCAGRWRWRRW